MEKGFSIQFVSKITGINPHTIRAWEKRYNAVSPQRDVNGRRLYQQQHIDKLSLLHELSSLGNPISDLAGLTLEELQNLYKNFFGDSKTVKREVKTSAIDFNSMLQNLVMALRLFKLDVISYELEKIKQDCSLREFALNLVAPILQEVGAMCDTGQITIAQEHALSAILKFHIGNILFNYAEDVKNLDHNVIIAAPEGELHEFGIMIAALLCKFYGIKFYYLGPDLPAESLLECAKQIKAKTIILGISRNMESKHPASVNKYLDTIWNELSDTKLIVGGFAHAPPHLRNSSINFIPTLKMLDLELSTFKGRM
jgi:DNA-binding transcriptional MerR regulator